MHFDVMDNHYVPNLTIGPMVCKALKNYGITAPSALRAACERKGARLARHGHAVALCTRPCPSHARFGGAAPVSRARAERPPGGPL